MAFRTQKISQMTPKGADLEATDLIEVSTIESGSYVTRSITGQELIDAIPLPPTGLTVGTTPIASGTIGRVLFQGTGNVLQQSGNLFWDSTNNRLGIGTSTPTFRLEVQGGDVRFANGLTIGTAGSAGWQFSSNTVTLIQNGFVSVDFANGREFSFTNASFSTTYLKLASVTGNVLINTTTDAGFRLDVNGTARVQGALTTTGTISAAANLIGRTDWNQGINCLGASGEIRFTNGMGGGFFYTWYQNTGERMRLTTGNNLLINTTTDAGFRLDVNGTARVSGATTIQTLTVGLGAGSQSNNTVLGLSALSSNTSGNFNVAIGPAALANNTTATGNVAIGHFAGVNIGTGSNNIAIGREAFQTGGGSSASNSNVVIGTAACNAATGSSNVVLGASAQAGNFSGSVVFGRAATADGNNQFVVGSATYNAGIIDTATVTPDKRWIVKINGVNYYIALQTV